MKSEIKIEFEDSERLSKFFETSYKNSTIKSRCSPLKIDEVDSIHKALKSINGGVIRIVNKDVIDGFCRFIISVNGSDMELIPISIHGILIDKRWNFF
jgi:hypothetical protein